MDQQFIQNALKLLPQFHRIFIHPLNAMARDTVSPSQLRVLFMLENVPSKTMSCIAAQMEIPKQQLTRIIDGLVESGLVERLADVKDRRKTAIHITPAALSYLDDLRKRMVDAHCRQFACFTEDELTHLNTAVLEIQRLLSRLDA